MTPSSGNGLWNNWQAPWHMACLNLLKNLLQIDSKLRDHATMQQVR